MFGGFGAAAAMGRYRQFKESALKLPRRTVTRATFIRRAIAAGISPENARTHATICQHMGSHVQIGAEWLGVSKPKRKKN